MAHRKRATEAARISNRTKEAYTMTPTIREIQTRTADFCGVRLEDLLSERRSGDVARARQIAMYAARIATQQSLPAIARAFNRDHTTVMYAVNKIDQRLWLDQEPGLYDAVKFACSSEIGDWRKGADHG